MEVAVEGCSDSEESSSEQMIKKELSDIPLGELQGIRQKIGTKKFDSVLEQTLKNRDRQSGLKQDSFKRANKNRPREMSSKRPVPRHREVITVRKHEVRDPRFDEKSGALNPHLFEKSYAFLEEMKAGEKRMVQKAARRARNMERKEELQRLLQQMESREASRKKQEERQALLREHRKTERENQKHGKKPFYIKKSAQKKLEMAQKYKELKRSGKLDKFLSKRRKKNASRDRKQLPFKRKP